MCHINHYGRLVPHSLVCSLETFMASWLNDVQFFFSLVLFCFTFIYLCSRKSLCHPLYMCYRSTIWTSGWCSHENIKLDKSRLILPHATQSHYLGPFRKKNQAYSGIAGMGLSLPIACDRQLSVHIFDLEHNGWHNLIIYLYNFYVILLSASCDSHFLKSILILYCSEFRGILDTVPLGFDKFHGFGVDLLIRVYYPNRSSGPYYIPTSNINGSKYFGSLVLTFVSLHYFDMFVY